MATWPIQSAKARREPSSAGGASGRSAGSGPRSSAGSAVAGGRPGRAADRRGELVRTTHGPGGGWSGGEPARLEGAGPGVRDVGFGRSEAGVGNQGGGLEGLAGLLLSQPLRGQPAQLVVDQGQELHRGIRVALLDRREDTRDVVHGRLLAQDEAAETMIVLKPRSSYPSPAPFLGESDALSLV